MARVLFVCLGNICRSPMAEFVFRDLVKKQGLERQFEIASAGTSGEEEGNPVHHGTSRKLAQHGISTAGKYARRFVAEDYDRYDYLIGMESRNVESMRHRIGEDSEGKLFRLLDFTSRPGDIADPWYTGDFDLTYDDVLEGCTGLLEFLKKK